MLITFIKRGSYGYLREDRVGIYNFISNNNLALRRQAIAETKGYDESLRIAEDYDVCQRLGRAGWLLYFCPEVSCYHRARKKIRGLLKQWWNYGLHLAPGYRRHHPGRVVVSLGRPLWQDDDNPEPIRRSAPARYGRLRQAVGVFLHVSLFVTMHAAAGAALLSTLVYGIEPLTWTMALLAAALLAGYARPDFKHLPRDGWRKALGLFAIRFAVNSAFVWGGLLGGGRCGAFYVFPPIHMRIGAAESPASLEGIPLSS